MKNGLTILFFFIAIGFAMAQAPTTTKKVDIVSKTGKKLSFSEIKIESDDNDSYKTLEIRYSKLDSQSAKEVTIEGKTYKAFKDKASAVKYYYLVKKNAPKVVIYYVYSLENKKPEIFTFRITE